MYIKTGEIPLIFQRNILWETYVSETANNWLAKIDNLMSKTTCLNPYCWVCIWYFFLCFSWAYSVNRKNTSNHLVSRGSLLPVFSDAISMFLFLEQSMTRVSILHSTNIITCDLENLAGNSRVSDLFNDTSLTFKF